MFSKTNDMRPAQKITSEMLDKRNKFMSIVSHKTGVPTDDIMSESRTRKVASARMMVMWALHTLCGYTTTAIGVMMRRHYSSVIHAVGLVNVGYLLSKEEKDLKQLLKRFHRGEEVLDT